MHDDDKKTGIKIYTLIFVLVLVSFIGFIIYKGLESKDASNNNYQKRSQIKTNN